MDLIKKRLGDEGCLACGSRHPRPFDGDYSLELGHDFLFVGSKRTGFIHPGCGGEFIAEGCDIRFHLVRTTKSYSLEGVLVDEVDSSVTQQEYQHSRRVANPVARVRPFRKGQMARPRHVN